MATSKTVEQKEILNQDPKDTQDVAGKTETYENNETSRSTETKVEEIVKVKALVNLKYNKEIIKIGEEFIVKQEELESMIKKGYIEKIK